MKAVCDTHNIPFAQTWFTSTAETNIQTIMCTQEKGSYMMFKKLSTFQRDCIQFCLKKGQGVVGTAFTSCTSCFCKDVKQLSIDQYPSVLSARKVGLTGAFAIYLQNKCTGNDVYVLELFLPSNQTTFRKPQTFLNSLIATVKQHFQSFKVACGDESETGIHRDIIKLDKDDRLDSFEICATNQSPPVLRLAQNQLETLHDGRNYITTKHDDIVAVQNKESVLKASEFKPLRNQSEQKLEDIESISHGKHNVLEEKVTSHLAYGKLTSAIFFYGLLDHYVILQVAYLNISICMGSMLLIGHLTREKLIIPFFNKTVEVLKTTKQNHVKETKHVLFCLQRNALLLLPTLHHQQKKVKAQL